MTALERVLVSISEQLDAAMRRRRTTTRGLAVSTGRTFTGTVSSVLGARNHTVRTLVDLADGLELDVEVRLVPRASQENSSAK